MLSLEELGGLVKRVREQEVGGALLRLVALNGGYVGVVFTQGKQKARVEGTNADAVWQNLLDEAGRLSPRFFGFDGARARFLRIMPGGFTNVQYVAEERAYKLRARAKLEAVLPLHAALNWSGHGEGALAAFRATNLLSPFESTRMQEALRSSAAPLFIRGAASFAEGDVERGLRDMAQALKPSDVAKWTAVTYLPFLWRPEAHMFLKPEVTRDFAARVGHQFNSFYSPELQPAVYQALLDLVAKTRREVADLGPADNIDIQSFIWVVGKYTAQDEDALRQRAGQSPINA